MKRASEDFVHRVDVFREPVEDATKRCSVKEGHGRTENIGEKLLVQSLGGHVASQCHGNPSKYDRHTLQHAKYPVDSQVTATMGDKIRNCNN